jgi:hypothetical protein
MFLLFIRFFMLTRKMRPVHEPIYNKSPVRTSISYRVFIGTVSQDFLLQAFHESCYPGLLIIPLEPFGAVSQIREDIRNSLYTTGAQEKLFTKKPFLNLVTLTLTGGKLISCTLKPNLGTWVNTISNKRSTVLQPDTQASNPP